MAENPNIDNRISGNSASVVLVEASKFIVLCVEHDAVSKYTQSGKR